MEVLIRGDKAPDDIILDAVLSDQIAALDMWVIESTIESMAKLNGDKKIFINCHPLTIEKTETLLSKKAFDLYVSNHINIVLEITEQMPLDLEKYLYHKDQLKSMNIKLAIDDFGKNNCNFNFLLHTSPDVVKIDRCITENIYNKEMQEFIKDIKKLSMELSFDIVAEGIENGDEAAIYKELGIEIGQGWFFSGPVSFDKLKKYIESKTGQRRVENKRSVSI